MDLINDFGAIGCIVDLFINTLANLDPNAFGKIDSTARLSSVLNIK